MIQAVLNEGAVSCSCGEQLSRTGLPHAQLHDRISEHDRGLRAVATILICAKFHCRLPIRPYIQQTDSPLALLQCSEREGRKKAE